MDKELSLITRIKLRIHYLMCAFCERYAKQRLKEALRQ